jgi:hypothetical protein
LLIKIVRTAQKAEDHT